MLCLPNLAVKSLVTNAELQQEIAELRDLIRTLQEASLSVSATVWHVCKELKLPKLPEFDGKPPEYAAFMNHLDLYF